MKAEARSNGSRVTAIQIPAPFTFAGELQPAGSVIVLLPYTGARRVFTAEAFDLLFIVTERDELEERVG